MTPGLDHPFAEFPDILLLDRMQENAYTDPLHPFALDELLCRRAGEGGPPICHLWRHPAAFVMGLRDSRLPYAWEAKRWLEAQGCRVAVRNSGGAAVPLDLGVVNISLILPKRDSAGMRFHNDFERMYRLIGQALADTGRRVDKGEIAGSYCPGDYDLSIGGYKFCGIAQRRQTNAYVVQAFVIVEGSGRERARLVRSFYEIAAEGAAAASFPDVREDSMASLSQLAGARAGTAASFAEAVKRAMRLAQTGEGMADAAARLTMPPGEDVAAMAESLRVRYKTAPGG